MNNSSHKSLAILVHGCDRYKLLFEGQQAFFHRSWDFSLSNCSYYLGLESVQLQFDHFKSLNSGHGEWSDRLYKLLEQIPEPYILYMQEDMWPTRLIDSHLLGDILTFALSSNAEMIKLHSSSVYKTSPTDKVFGGLRLSLLDNHESDYLMSHQITLWNREFLMKQLPSGEHPWRHERRGTKRLKKLNPRIYHLDLFAENGHPPINDNPDNALRSAYATVSYNACFNEQALPLLEELARDARHTSYAQKCLHHFHQGLTHDGRPRPHKEDIFKKIKTKLKGLFRSREL